MWKKTGIFLLTVCIIDAAIFSFFTVKEERDALKPLSRPLTIQEMPLEILQSGARLIADAEELERKALECDAHAKRNELRQQAETLIADGMEKILSVALANDAAAPLPRATVTAPTPCTRFLERAFVHARWYAQYAPLKNPRYWKIWLDRTVTDNKSRTEAAERVRRGIDGCTTHSVLPLWMARSAAMTFPLNSFQWSRKEQLEWCSFFTDVFQQLHQKFPYDYQPELKTDHVWKRYFSFRCFLGFCAIPLAALLLIVAMLSGRRFKTAAAVSLLLTGTFFLLTRLQVKYESRLFPQSVPVTKCLSPAWTAKTEGDLLRILVPAALPQQDDVLVFEAPERAGVREEMMRKIRLQDEVSSQFRNARNGNFHHSPGLIFTVKKDGSLTYIPAE